MFRGETAFCQGGADLILGVGGEILPEFFNTGRAVVAPDLLLEIADLEIFAQLAAAGEGRNQAHNTL